MLNIFFAIDNIVQSLRIRLKACSMSICLSSYSFFHRGKTTANVLSSGLHNQVLLLSLPVMSDISGHFRWHPATRAYPASKTLHEASLGTKHKQLTFSQPHYLDCIKTSFDQRNLTRICNMTEW